MISDVPVCGRAIARVSQSERVCSSCNDNGIVGVGSWIAGLRAGFALAALGADFALGSAFFATPGFAFVASFGFAFGLALFATFFTAFFAVAGAALCFTGADFVAFRALESGVLAFCLPFFNAIVATP
jgi:hypothetical protein